MTDPEYQQPSLKLSECTREIKTVKFITTDNITCEYPPRLMEKCIRVMNMYIDIVNQSDDGENIIVPLGSSDLAITFADFKKVLPWLEYHQKDKMPYTKEDFLSGKAENPIPADAPYKYDYTLEEKWEYYRDNKEVYDRRPFEMNDWDRETYTKCELEEIRDMIHIANILGIQEMLITLTKIIAQRIHAITKEHYDTFVEAEYLANGKNTSKLSDIRKERRKIASEKLVEYFGIEKCDLTEEELEECNKEAEAVLPYEDAELVEKYKLI